MEIRSLENTPIEQILDAFMEAFSDYAVDFPRNQVSEMFRRRGFNPKLSFAAFERERIVAFTLNGIGLHDGRLTCYDCATGTLPQYRGAGLAGKIFRHALPVLKEAGVEQYLLEVLQENDTAIALYTGNGFNKDEEYDCYSAAKSEVNVGEESGINNSVEFRDITSADVSEKSHWWDCLPSWQNSVDSVTRGESELLIRGAFLPEEGCVGYIVSDPATGDIAQIAVDPKHRRKGIATALISHILEFLKCERIKLLNISSNSLTLPLFLSAIGLTLGLSQYSMILPLI